MKRLTLPLFAVCAAGALAVSGCTNSYSEAIRYGVRTDPVVLTDKLGDDRQMPDSPGLLPLLSVKDLYDPRNPLSVNNLFEAKMASLAFADAERRKKLEEELAKERQEAASGKHPLLRSRAILNPDLLTVKDREEFGHALEELFGTPAQPKVDLGEEVIDVLKVDRTTLAKGSRLYRIHCLHCHGVAGDGRGPTARWINPHPRDYRTGLFKFQSVDQSTIRRPPNRADLYHTLHQGIEGTAMPAFSILPKEDLEAMVGYVIHLTLRGRAEYQTFASNMILDTDTGKLKFRSEDPRVDSIAAAIENNATIVAKEWLASQDPKNLIQAPPYPIAEGDTEALQASVRRGHALFIGKADEKIGVDAKAAQAANCVSCHKDYGRQAYFKWDEWGTLVQPRDLTRGNFRGGRRPIDVYRRIHSGINGSGMTNFAKLSPEHLWDLVNFVQTMPYPGMRRQMGIHID